MGSHGRHLTFMMVPVKTAQLERDDLFANRRYVERRLHKVPDGARPMLKLAAVIGRRIDLAILRAAVPDAEGWLVACAGAAVLEAVEQSWQFAPDKLRERLLEDIAPPERALRLLQGDALRIPLGRARARLWEGAWDLLHGRRSAAIRRLEASAREAEQGGMAYDVELANAALRQAAV